MPRGATTGHDKNLQTLAANVQNLPPVDPSSWQAYVPIGLLFLCLLVFDTETRTQHTLLGLLTLVAAVLLWLGCRLQTPAKEACFRKKAVIREGSIPGGNVRVFDDSSIELQTAAGTRVFRSFAELEFSLRAGER